MLKTYSALLALALSLGAATTLPAQTRYNAQPGAGNSMRVDGTSTTHDWEMEGKVIGGFLQLGPGVTLDPNAAEIAGLENGKIPATGRANVIISSLHSKAEHMPEVMDNLTQKAMKAEQFPAIVFNLTELAPNGTHAAGKPFTFTATGSLTISGVTNKITMPLSITVVDDTHLTMSGSVPLKMTSYGIDPPAPNIGLGLMKCGDDVKISFDWRLAKKAK